MLRRTERTVLWIAAYGNFMSADAAPDQRGFLGRRSGIVLPSNAFVRSPRQLRHAGRAGRGPVLAGSGAARRRSAKAGVRGCARPNVAGSQHRPHVGLLPHRRIDDHSPSYPRQNLPNAIGPTAMGGLCSPKTATAYLRQAYLVPPRALPSKTHFRQDAS